MLCDKMALQGPCRDDILGASHRKKVDHSSNKRLPDLFSFVSSALERRCNTNEHATARQIVSSQSTANISNRIPK